MIVDDDREDDFLTSAGQAMQGPSGAAALESLGWFDLLADLHDHEARTAVFAVFRAQGRHLADSPALGALVAQPFLAGTAIAPGTVVAAIRRVSARRGPVWLVIGDTGGRALLLADPAHGAVLVDPGDAVLVPIDVPGRATVHEVVVDASRHAALPLGDLAARHRRTTELGRIAAATEILGATERAVQLAVEHAAGREQFGRPIGTFQAVRHLLARAKADCVAIDAVTRKALLTLDDLPPRFDAVVKALAGRNGRSACERSLQVLGGIGFTAEHSHHHLHSRVLALDSLLGTSAALQAELGRWLRTAQEDPGYAASLVGRTP